MSDDAERDLPPTPKRLAKARTDGQAARSALASGALTLAAAGALSVGLRPGARWWMDYARAMASRAAVAPHATAGDLITVALAGFSAPAPCLFIVCAWLVAVSATLLAAASCGGISPAWAALRPSGARLSWAGGVRKLTHADGAGAALALCAALAVASGAVAALRWSDEAVPGADFRASMGALGGALADLWRRAVPLTLLVGAVDVVVQRRRFVRGLRMTPREMKNERADSEGKPEIKARRRNLAARHVRGLRIAAIKRATAVVTNPTHLAVALRYSPPAIDVPVIVARGADLAADLVRGAAESYGVPIVEAPELARLLYANAEADGPIPEEAYAAVAAVFAWILRTRGALPGAGDADHGSRA